MRTVQGREVADWISVSHYLTHADNDWDGVTITGAFSVDAGGQAGRPGDVIVRELDGSLSIAEYPK